MKRSEINVEDVLKWIWKSNDYVWKNGTMGSTMIFGYHINDYEELLERYETGISAEEMGLLVATSQINDRESNKYKDSLDIKNKYGLNIDLSLKKELDPIKTPGHVYFIKDEHGRIKIGKTRNLEKRIKSYGTSNSGEITLVGSIYYKDKYSEMEKEWHEKFKDKRIKGERFELTEKEIEIILESVLLFNVY